MRHRVLVVVSGCFLLAQSVLGSQLYAITDLGPGRALAINNQGQVLGYDTVGSYLFSNGQKQYLPQPSGGTFSATALNDLGQVAGYVNYAGQYNFDLTTYSQGAITVRTDLSGLDPTGLNNNGVIVGTIVRQHQGFILSNDALTPIAGLPLGVNSAGIAVGGVSDGDKTRAFSYQNGQASYLTPAGISSEATAINNAGEIVGSLSVPGGSGAPQTFVYKDGQYTVLNYAFDPNPYGQGDRATAVNDAGLIIGNSVTIHGAFAWSYDPTSGFSNLIDEITTPGWRQFELVSGVNDEGDIVGLGQINGNFDAFLLTPTDGSQPATTPEPASVGLLILGCAIAVGWGLRPGAQTNSLCG